METSDQTNSATGNDRKLSQPYYYSMNQFFSSIQFHLGILKMNIEWGRQDNIKEGCRRTIDSIPGNERYCCWGLIYPDEMKELLLELNPQGRVDILTLILENIKEFKDIYDVVVFMVFVLNWADKETIDG